MGGGVDLGVGLGVDLGEGLGVDLGEGLGVDLGVDLGEGLGVDLGVGSWRMKVVEAQFQFRVLLLSWVGALVWAIDDPRAVAVAS